MNMIIQDDDFLSQENKNFINNTLLSDNFPFFYNEWRNLSYMGHNVVLRNGLRNSDYYEDFMSMLYAFTTKHDIQVNRILRCSLNMTFPLFEGTSPIHKDHEEEHKQLILYLNDVDCNTVLCDEDRMPVQHITPVQYRGVCFDNRYHYANLPRNGRRLIVVYTFN